jgi:hypothetical protein
MRAARPCMLMASSVNIITVKAGEQILEEKLPLVAPDARTSRIQACPKIKEGNKENSLLVHYAFCHILEARFRVPANEKMWPLIPKKARIS